MKISRSQHRTNGLFGIIILAMLMLTHIPLLFAESNQQPFPGHPILPPGPQRQLCEATPPTNPGNAGAVTRRLDNLCTTQTCPYNWENPWDHHVQFCMDKWRKCYCDAVEYSKIVIDATACKCAADMLNPPSTSICHNNEPIDTCYYRCVRERTSIFRYPEHFKIATCVLDYQACIVGKTGDFFPEDEK
jgi:hypothetical protein